VAWIPPGLRCDRGRRGATCGAGPLRLGLRMTPAADTGDSDWPQTHRSPTTPPLDVFLAEMASASHETFVQLKGQCLDLCSALKVDVKKDVLSVETESFAEGLQYKSTVSACGRRQVSVSSVARRLRMVTLHAQRFRNPRCSFLKVKARCWRRC
jgi:hypothetical protein